MRGMTSQSATPAEWGPVVVPGDSPLLRRLRREQARYRAEVLCLPTWGSTPQGRPIGSILDAAAAAAGLNFTSGAARRLYEQRRLAGWGVDPTRITAHMTSSQALLFNLFGIFDSDFPWLTRTVAQVLERSDIDAVVAIHVEHAPQRLSDYLNDHTIIDGLIEIATESGPELVALELKYADRFSSRRVRFDGNPRYAELALNRDIWSVPLSELAAPRFNQLTRVHALAERIAEVNYADHTPCTLVVLSHPDDETASAGVSAYRKLTTVPSRVRHVSLESALSAIERTAMECGQRVARVRDRYLPANDTAPAFR